MAGTEGGPVGRYPVWQVGTVGPWLEGSPVCPAGKKLAGMIPKQISG